MCYMVLYLFIDWLMLYSLYVIGNVFILVIYVCLFLVFFFNYDFEILEKKFFLF